MVNTSMKSEELMIIKRDGSIRKFDISKIKKAIQWACIGIDVNPLELESKVHINVHHKMSTSQIQSTLISTALQLTNLENDMLNLNWRFVAARLLLLNMYKGAKRTRCYNSFGYGSYYEFLKIATESGLYDSKILDTYTEDEILELEMERNANYDLEYDYAGMNLLNSRYLIRKDKLNFELPQDMFMSLSLLLAIPEDKSVRIKVAKEFYHEIAKRKISLATPILLNLRRKSGNLSSCFITSMDDSLDSIYYTLDQVAQISKNAGGVGVNLSRIRSKGSFIKGFKGASGGALPWVKLLNDTAVAVDQLGSRSGAVTVALDIWHKDIEDFLDLQTENGDHRKKSFDIFPQIVVSDLFMNRVENNEQWTLLDPHEIEKKYDILIAELYGSKFEEVYLKLEKDASLELSKQISAKDLFKRILRTVVETGMPYVFFKDTVNNLNPNKHAGFIGNANLCVESFSNFKPSNPKSKSLDGNKLTQVIDAGEVHTCNLVSLNLAILRDNLSDIEKATALSVRILDNALELSASPIPESDIHNNTYRVLGVGVMGLSDYLVSKRIKYEESKEIVGKLFEKISYAGILASSNLAKSRGSYSAYSGSEWSKGIFFGKDDAWFKANSSMYDKWSELLSLVKKQGMRNGGLFAIAPNTSTSLLCGASASILPIYKKFFIDKASNGAVPVCPPNLNSETFWWYTENPNLDQLKVIDVVSEVQKWVDQGISMEIVLNIQKGISAKDIYNYYLTAWKKGCKTVYYVRSITLKADNSKECVSCAN